MISQIIHGLACVVEQYWPLLGADREYVQFVVDICTIQTICEPFFFLFLVTSSLNETPS